MEPTPPTGGPWGTLEFGVEGWGAVLGSFGVDKDSYMELWALAHFGPEGPMAANNVLAKLLKKRADKVELSNPSAFVHTCVVKARHAIQSAEESKF